MNVFVVGGVVEKPWLYEGLVTPRKVLSLSVMVDHDLVDGAPAARFVERLRQRVESAEGLPAPGSAGLDRGAAPVEKLVARPAAS